MFARTLTATAFSIGFCTPAFAASSDTQALFDALELPQIIEVMRAEGIAYGGQLGTDMSTSQVNATWAATVEKIYEPTKMLDDVRTAFDAALAGDDVPAMLAFFDSEPGKTFAQLEVSARRALLDDAVDDASKELAAIAADDQTDRYKLVTEIVQANDLIETNVVGALNSNYAFYKGLMAGGAFEDGLTDEQMLSDVWDQESEIRTTTTQWIYSFLLLAYNPATDADIKSYIAFSQSEAGKQLNQSLFEAFDGMFNEISYDLGREVARMMAGAEL